MARSAEFDREAVLDRATMLFWERGYAETSICQLVEATGLKPGSLYAAFESKEGLFLSVLDRYAQLTRARIRAVLAAAADPLSGVEAVLQQLADSDAQEAQRGCLLVNSVLEVGRRNGRVQERIGTHLTKVEAMLCQALDQARAYGLLSPEKSPDALAKFLMATIWGMRVLGATGGQVASARLVVAEAMHALCDRGACSA